MEAKLLDAQGIGAAGAGAGAGTGGGAAGAGAGAGVGAGVSAAAAAAASREAAAAATAAATAERDFNVYLCESLAFLSTMQCAYYLLFFAFSAVVSTVINALAAENPLDTLFALGFVCTSPNSTSSNCSSDTAPAVFVTGALLGGLCVVQTIAFVVSPILIRRRRFQERWTCVSTVIMSVSAVFGTVSVDVYSIILLGFTNAALPSFSPNNGTAAVGSDAENRYRLLNAITAPMASRVAGLTALQLLAFTPRFKPYVVVCGVLLAVEIVAQVAMLVILFDGVGHDSVAWTNWVGQLDVIIISDVLYCNVTAWMVRVEEREEGG
jgi:hypothetical protein